MTTNFQKIIEFHKAFNLPNGNHPHEIDDPELLKLRLGLIEEEWKEVNKAINEKEGLAAVTKELTDLLYVVYGMLAVMGVDADAAFAEVHTSNMTKLGPDGKPVYREDGKVLKGPNYRPVDPVKLVNPIK